MGQRGTVEGRVARPSRVRTSSPAKKKNKMVRTIEYKDPTRVELIRSLEKAGRENSARVWAAVALKLSNVRRNRPQVNIHKIDKATGEGDTVVVAGKVLGEGSLTHNVIVAAYKFTEGAMRKIEAAGGKAITIEELISKNPKGNKIRIIG
jgi:large subunit ribosomal protein L18e